MIMIIIIKQRSKSIISKGNIISFIIIMIIKLFSLKFLKTCLISTNNLEFMNER